MYKSVNTHSYINQYHEDALSVTNKKNLPFFSKIGHLRQQLLKIIVLKHLTQFLCMFTYHQ